MTQRCLEILILWDNPTHVAATVQQQVNALKKHSKHRVHTATMMGDLPSRLDLNRFDAVVLHYSLVVSHDAYVSEQARTLLRGYQGAKAVFIQDEYRHVNQTVAALKQIDIQALFTCVPDEEVEKVYPATLLPGIIRKNVLTGYVDDSLLGLAVPDPSLRPIDIGYRARKVPAWLGELGQEKWNIGQRVLQDAPAFGLRVDLAHREEERLYGQAWIDFMTECKATLGVESGASVFDFSGSVKQAVEQHLAVHPESSFAELQRQHFGHLEGLIKLNQISPRCFEAACLRTLMILYEGDYSGRLIAGRHYLPLRKDHSNFAEVVAVLKNSDEVRYITDRAYSEVACAEVNSFRSMVSDFDAVMSQAAIGRKARAGPSYSTKEVDHLSGRRTFRANWLIVRRTLFTRFYFFLFGQVLTWLPESRRDQVQRLIGRVVSRIKQIAGRKPQ